MKSFLTRSEASNIENIVVFIKDLTAPSLPEAGGLELSGNLQQVD